MKYLKNIVNKKQVLTLSMIYIIWVVALFNFRIVKNFNFRFFVALLFGTISYAVTMSYILKFSKNVRETSVKQFFSYSNALSSDATREIDAIIADKIDKLVEAIENDKKEKVIKGLENLMTDIKYRNAIKSKNTAKER